MLDVYYEYTPGPRLIAQGFPASMIVCSCNVFSDHDVRDVVRSAAPRTTAEVYGRLGCSAQCGRCAISIRKIMDEAAPQRGADGDGAAPHKPS